MVTHPNRSKRKIAPAISSRATSPRVKRQHEHDYSGLLAGVAISFQKMVARGACNFFMTDLAGSVTLNDLYLRNIPMGQRQVHDCSACRRFIKRFGGLVHIAEDGHLESVMWNPDAVPAYYRAAFTSLRSRVERAPITGVFRCEDAVWGTPITGHWSHMSVEPPAHLRFERTLLTANQAMAAAKENFKTVSTALLEYPAEALDQALRLFEGDHLARSEKFIAPVRWLRALHDRPKGRAGYNRLWAAIAEAPEGFCHPKTSVVGPLLDSIIAGEPTRVLQGKFNAMLGPLIYQRPQAPPAAGNIKQAEAIFEQMGLAPALERRFARLDELKEFTWTPADTPTQKRAISGAVFGHIQPKGTASVPPVSLPATTMTWVKFASEVLERAEQIEMEVPYQGNFIAITTAVNPDARPILKWDNDEERNPFALYVYPKGSRCTQWGLLVGWRKVTAITPFPQLWGAAGHDYLGKGVVLILEGAVDSNDKSGNALFPEALRQEVYPVRSTIEAYSKSAVLGGREEASACGYCVSAGAAIGTVVRVFSGGAWSAYRIDRWD